MNRAVLLVLLAVVAVVDWRVFTVFFAVDDFTFLAAAAGPLRVPDPAEVFAGRYFSADTLFRVGLTIFGTSAALFHVLSLGLHVANAVLVHRVALRLLNDRRVALIAAILFAAHPVAYTPAAWLAAGFNEFPVQTLSLVSLWLLLSDLESPRVWKSPCMALCVIVAAGFKQHAVLIPLYWAAVLIARGMADGFSRRGALRGIVAIVLLAPFYVFFQMQVLPRMRVIFAGPYERVFDAGSLLGTLAHLALGALNPLPVARESLNVLVPGAGLRLATPVAAAGAVLLAAAVCGTAWTTMRERRHRAWTVVAVPLMASLLLLPASMPNHVYEYYVYLSLPAVSMLWALALAGLAGRRVSLLPRSAQVTLAAVLLVGLWAQGAHLHRTSDVVAQAGRARAIDRIAARVPARTQLLVVPPSDQARLDTVFGRSIDVLHGARGVSIQFVNAQGAPAVLRSAPPWQLVAVDPERAQQSRVMLLERAEWRVGRESLTLSPTQRSIEQPFSGVGALAGIQISGDSLGRVACSIEYAIDARDRPGARRVGEGRLDCRDLVYGTFVTLPFSSPSTAPDTPYLLRLVFHGESGVVRLNAAPPEVGGLVYRVLAADRP